ncbi:hypothetical protein [Bdellovibrio sp. HCB2-146]|uniref:hypothetical protein n=1 Tax=Bdellovibrio sp. HCB2-146 TaxID=3394362 RepID=UPI0039BD7094
MKALSLFVAALLTSLTATAKISIDCVDTKSGKNLHASIYPHSANYGDGSTHWIQYKLERGFESSADGWIENDRNLIFLEDGQRAFSISKDVLSAKVGQNFPMRTQFPSYSKLNCQVLVVDLDRGQ